MVSYEAAKRSGLKPRLPAKARKSIYENGRDKCPSWGCKLKVEDSQTKLITCEYCGASSCWTMRKSSILQITIYQTTPSAKTRNGAKIAWCRLACAGVLLAALSYPPVRFFLRAADCSPSIPPPARIRGKEGEAGEVRRGNGS